jgi:hypothetical protein
MVTALTLSSFSGICSRPATPRILERSLALAICDHSLLPRLGTVMSVAVGFLDTSERLDYLRRLFWITRA